MDEDRRTKLIEKRRMAQLRLDRQRVSATFRAVAPGLCEAGVRFSRLSPKRCRAALGTLASGPGRDERLTWDHVTGASCSYWTTPAERDLLLAQALAGCVPPESPVALVWHPFESGIRIRAGDLAAHAARLLVTADTVWIVAAGGGRWLIELAYWDRELCWARAMPPA